MKTKTTINNFFSLVFVLLSLVSTNLEAKPNRCIDIFKTNLSSSRVSLRALSKSVIAEVKDILTDKKIVRMSGDDDWSNSQIEKLLKSNNREVNLGFFVDNKLVGLGGLFRGGATEEFQAQNNFLDQQWYSIYFYINPKFWGNGFATESAGLLVKYAFNELRADGVHAFTLMNNSDSQNVLTKLKFEESFGVDQRYKHFFILNKDL